MSAGCICATMGVRQADGHRLRVEFSRTVMAEVRAAAMEGFHRLSRGGLEVGGILLGARNADAIRILGWRPIQCRHAHGPSFSLVPEDEAGLAQLLSDCERDPELAGMAPVGWFHSHTRGEIGLSESDVALYDRFFPAPWQMAMVLRPARDGATRAGFFFREAEGRLRAESSHREFELEAEFVPALNSGHGRRTSSAAAPPEAVPTPVREAPAPPASRRRRWALGAVMACALAGLGGVGLVHFLFQAPEPPVALSVLETGGQLQVEWDRAARPLLVADRGKLLIWDGPETRELVLDQQMLRHGRVVYARRSGEVKIRLLLEKRNSASAQETVQFLAPAPADVSHVGQQ